MVCAKSLKGRRIEALDGLIGHVDDLYFDDRAWKVRYLVVKTGNWLPGRKVLIAPEALVNAWHGESGVPVCLTKEQVRSSPDIDTAHPVSRVAEQLLHHHYGWRPYWAAGGLDPHLCCVRDVLGYKLLAKDGQAGQLEDFLIHEDDAEVWYLAVHVARLLPKTVLIRTCNVSGFDWARRGVSSPLSCHEVEVSPEFEDAAGLPVLNP